MLTSSILGRRVATVLMCVGAATATAAGLEVEHRPSRQEETKKEKPADQRVSGTVVDRGGTAVNRAEVTFRGPKQGAVLTNSNGHFTFTGPPGDYTITVRAGERSQSFDRKIENNQLKPDSTLVLDPEGQ
jgi:Carboxypeptidase regulatory-like domain